jgi:hypothetical protein
MGTTKDEVEFQIQGLGTGPAGQRVRRIGILNAAAAPANGTGAAAIATGRDCREFLRKSDHKEGKIRVYITPNGTSKTNNPIVGADIYDAYTGPIITVYVVGGNDRSRSIPISIEAYVVLTRVFMFTSHRTTNRAHYCSIFADMCPYEVWHCHNDLPW